MELVNTIARTLPVPHSGERHRRKAAAVAATPLVKPVLQFMPLPVTLDPNQFAGARSNTNPSGNLLPLFAFRDLVDPLPSFATYFTGGPDSTEDVYGMILNGAVIDSGESFAATVLAESRRRFADVSFANLDGTPGDWRPVYASPSDWYDLTNSERFQVLQIDLSDAGSADSPYAMIGGGAPLRLSSGGQPLHDRSLDPATRLHTLSMKCLLVTLQRPWLNRMVFETSGWRLPEQPRGFCSSGALDENGGVIPLLPTAVLLATDVGLDATWSQADRDFIEREDESHGSVSLGPFPLGPSASTSSLQAVAWINALTPFSPADAG